MMLTTNQLERAMLLKKIIIARLINIIPHIRKGFAKINKAKPYNMQGLALEATSPLKIFTV